MSSVILFHRSRFIKLTSLANEITIKTKYESMPIRVESERRIHGDEGNEVGDCGWTEDGADC